MNDLFSSNGKVAIITRTGGVLGGSIAKSFLHAGAKCVAIDICEEKLTKRIAELSAFGRNIIGVVGNVLDMESLENVSKEVLAKWRRIDILLNIAGGNLQGATLMPDQEFFEMKISDWDKVTNLNLNGTVFPNMVFQRLISKQKSGSIINISSMVA